MNLFSALTVAFVVLKLLGVITWSWWWVLFFVWSPIAFVIGVIVTAVMVNKK